MKVLVGISGGVDSAITSYLLKKNGYDVIGLYMNFCENDMEKLSLIKTKIQNISDKLDIKIIYKDYKKEFKDLVIDYFVSEYKKGATPNPCVFCNGMMKFKKLLETKNELNIDKIATGHYANINKINDRFCIRKSKNEKKDQSYMLYTLSQEEIKDLILPLSDENKNEIREIATSLNLKVANEKDSQDICFIKDIDYKEFLKQYEFGEDYKDKIAQGLLSNDDIMKHPYFKKGEFIDKKGKVLGYHNGIVSYTIGQRKGLGIAFSERLFVNNIDVNNNKITLGNNEDLYSDSFKVKDIICQGLDEKIMDTIDFNDMIFTVKLRYRHDGTKCIVKKYGDILDCRLNEKVRAITKGQAAVFYDENESIMFGGTIV